MVGVGVFMGIVLLLMAGWMLGSWAQNLREGLAARAWPKTGGLVVASSVERQTWMSGDGPRFLYVPRVRYRYRVGGREFESARLRGGGTWTSRRIVGSGAKDVVARYPVGAAVEVRHHPEDPERALLEPGLPGGAVAALVAGLFMGLLGAAILAGLFFKMYTR